MNDEERNNLKIVFSGSDDQKKINKMMTWSQEFKNKRAIFDKMITALREEKNLEIDIVDSKWIHDRIIESNEGEAQLDRSLAQMHHVNSESLLSCGVYFSTKYIKEKKEYREKSKYLEEILKHTQSLDNWEKVYKKKDNK